MKFILLSFSMLFSFSSFAKEYKFDCDEFRFLKSSLDRVKDVRNIKSSTSPGKESIEYLTAFFEKAFSLRSEQEAGKFISNMNKCFSKDLSSKDYEMALRRADEIKYKALRAPVPEREGLSMIEITCAGFSSKEILELMKLQGGAAAGAKASVASSVGSTAVAIASAAVAGWVIGETIKLVDAQTGHYGFKYVGRPFDGYVLEPAVLTLMGVPSKKERLKTQASILALDVLIAYKEKRSSSK